MSLARSVVVYMARKGLWDFGRGETLDSTRRWFGSNQPQRTVHGEGERRPELRCSNAKR